MSLVGNYNNIKRTKADASTSTSGYNKKNQIDDIESIITDGKLYYLCYKCFNTFINNTLTNENFYHIKNQNYGRNTKIK